jgi:transcriptional regulator with XRE-family HTH domain
MIDLKSFRRDNNISQKEIVKILKLSQSYISEIENGIRPLLKDAYDKLYAIFGDDLLKYKRSENKKLKPYEINDEIKSKLLVLEKENEYLKQKIQDKDKQLADKEKIINLLENSGKRNKS